MQSREKRDTAKVLRHGSRGRRETATSVEFDDRFTGEFISEDSSDESPLCSEEG